MSDSENEKEKLQNQNREKSPRNISMMKKYRWSILTVTALAIAIIACYVTLMIKKDIHTNGVRVGDIDDERFSASFTNGVQEGNMNEESSFATFTNGMSKFSSDLYHQSIQGKTGNIAISPLSVASALGFLSQAANGTTFEEMKNGLHLKGEKATLAAHFNEYFHKLQQGSGNKTLAIFNQIFVQNGFEINENFRNVAVEKFLSGVQLVNFKDSVETAKTINGFVAEKTDNKIQDLIPSDALNEDTRAILVNAVAFTGKWSKVFERTRESKFHINESEIVPVDLMFNDDDFPYGVFNDLNATAVQMWYANSNYSLVIVLPHSINGLPELETKLKNYDLRKIVDGLQYQSINLAVPKFQISFNINLNSALKNLGMTEMFTWIADFSGILKNPKTDKPLFVSDVIHKTFINVHEGGTEAYAATAPILTVSANLRAPVFRADHPFFFFIWDNYTKNPLLSGRFTRPN